MANVQQFSCLLVDDDTGFASMLARIVAEEGGKPVACHTAEAARAQVARQPFERPSGRHGTRRQGCCWWAKPARGRNWPRVCCMGRAALRSAPPRPMWL